MVALRRDGQSFLSAVFNAEDTCIVIHTIQKEFAEKCWMSVIYYFTAGCSVYILEHQAHGYSWNEVLDAQKVYILVLKIM